jgi:hypothetical protein
MSNLNLNYLIFFLNVILYFPVNLEPGFDDKINEDIDKVEKERKRDKNAIAFYFYFYTLFS